MVTAFLFTAQFIFMIIGMPVAFSLGLASVLSVVFFSNDSLASLGLKFFQNTSTKYVLLAVPFFILASAFLTTGGVAQRLIRFATAVVGHFRGGLAMASVLACTFFAAVSGSSPRHRRYHRFHTHRRYGSRRVQPIHGDGRCNERGHSGHSDPTVNRDDRLCGRYGGVRSKDVYGRLLAWPHGHDNVDGDHLRGRTRQEPALPALCWYERDLDLRFQRLWRPVSDRHRAWVHLWRHREPDRSSGSLSCLCLLDRSRWLPRYGSRARRSLEDRR